MCLERRRRRIRGLLGRGVCSVDARCVWLGGVELEEME